MNLLEFCGLLCGWVIFRVSISRVYSLLQKLSINRTKVKIPTGSSQNLQRAVQRTPMLAGDSVVVMGLGSVGLLMLQAVKAISAARVCGVDLLPERLQLALDLGADAVLEAPLGEQALRDLFNPFTEGRGADAAILTAPGIKPFMQAVASVRMGGAITIFAAHAGAAPLDLLATRQVLVDRLISHRLPLERFNEGVALMREHKALKGYFQIL